MKNKFLILSVVTVSSFLSTSCGNTSIPSLGERILSEGNAVSDIGKKWQKGEDMIKKGEKLKRSGKRDIEKGEDLIKKGQKAKQNAEYLYKSKPAG